MADSRHAPGVQGSFFLVVNSYRNSQKPLRFADEGFRDYTTTFYTYLSFISRYQLVFDCTRDQFYKNLNNFLEEMGQYKGMDKKFYVAFIFLGHGQNNHLVMNDGNVVSISSVINRFVSEIPEEFIKLFIFDACRPGFSVPSHHEKNCIFIYSTLPNDEACSGSTDSPGRYGIWSYHFNVSLRVITGSLDTVRSSTDMLVRNELGQRSDAQVGQMISNGVASPCLHTMNRPELTENIISCLTKVTTEMKDYRGIL